MNLKVGDIISANDPLVHVVFAKKKNVICDYCVAYGKQLKRCSGCKQMFYCGRECQRADWAKHKYECKLYASYYHLLIANEVRILLRLLLFLTNNPQSMRRKYSLFYDKNIGRSYQDLMTHSDKILMDGSALLYCVISRNFKTMNISFDEDQLFEMFCKIRINAFGILNADMMPIGMGMYIAESMFDHSCWPNAATVSNGIHMEVRCIKPIKKNEPITLNYFDAIDSKAARQAKLKKTFYFDCNCPRCEQDLPRDFDYEQLNNSLGLMSEYMQNSMFKEAYEIGQKTFDDFTLAHENRPHPNVTAHLVRISNLRMLLYPDLDEEGTKLATKAANMVKLTYPEDHNMYQYYKPLMS